MAAQEDDEITINYDGEDIEECDSVTLDNYLSEHLIVTETIACIKEDTRLECDDDGDCPPLSDEEN